MRNQAKTIVNKDYFFYIGNAPHEPVAQLVEQRPFKAWAVRSNRTGLTMSTRAVLEILREWWNWQTHHLEGVAPGRACEFKSRLAHSKNLLDFDYSHTYLVAP